MIRPQASAEHESQPHPSLARDYTKAPTPERSFYNGRPWHSLHDRRLPATTIRRISHTCSRKHWRATTASPFDVGNSGRKSKRKKEGKKSPIHHTHTFFILPLPRIHPQSVACMFDLGPEDFAPRPGRSAHPARLSAGLPHRYSPPDKRQF